MIVGIGTDIIEMSRVLKACEKETFRKKYYTEKELEIAIINNQKLADNFAVKEAVSKMLGTGFREFGPIDIEVLRDSLGKPYVNLKGTALKIANEMKINHILVTISNTKDYAVAFVVGESTIL
jgi:holo-[acyl-carrier protein] synthase